MKKNIFKKPEFFIIGPPKSGTTSLRTYLREHPDIFMPRGEMNFFSKDIKSSTDYDNLEKYLQAFTQAPQGSIIGEKSVWYLYSKIAVSEILKFNPDAKFIVILRNPIEMAPSLHSQLKRGAQEDISDFRQAWLAQKERKDGKRIPRICFEPRKLQYGEVCKLGEQLEKIYTLVSKERVHVIFFDDFKKDTLDTYKNVLMFLGVPHDGRTNFPVVNKNKVIVYPKLLKLLYTIQYFKKKLPIPFLHLNLLARLKEKCRMKVIRVPLQDNLRQDLIEYFEKDIQKLSRLTGRDLSSWIA